MGKKKKDPRFFENQKVVSPEIAKSVDENAIKNTAYLLTEIWIEEILSEEKARSLHPSKNISIGLLFVVPRIVDGKIEIMTITERNSHDPRYPVTKFPSMTMKARDENLEVALTREAVKETDHFLTNFKFVCAGKYTSTVKDEQHYKICFLATKHQPASITVVRVGEKIKVKAETIITTEGARQERIRPKKTKFYYPTEPGIISVNWRPIEKIQDWIPKAQKTMFGPIVKAIQQTSPEFWRKTPNIHPELAFIEGAFDKKIIRVAS